MEEGEPEVHTTELTAFSAAHHHHHHPDNNNSNIIMEDELTTPSATTKSIEGHDLVNSCRSLEQQSQQQQQQLVVRLPPFFKAAEATITPNTDQQHQQHARQPAPFFPTAPVTMPSTASSSSNTAVDTTPAAAAAASAAASSPPPHSFSSTYSLFPPTSSSSSLDFTAAWVASTPFAAAAPLSISPPSDGCSGEGGVGGAAPLATGAIYEQRPPHFLAPKIATVAPSMLSSAASSMSTASMLSSSSFGKARPAGNLIGISQQQPQHQHHLFQHSRPPPFAAGSGDAAMDEQQSSLFLQNHQPQFITPSVSVFRYPAGNIGGNSIININTNTNNNVISSNSSDSESFAVAPPFFVPSVGAVGEGFGSVSLNHIRGGGGGGGGGGGAPSAGAAGKFKYPLYNRHPASSTNQLGRHWKQMGSHTRQYLQPSIPLPASTRLASAAAKQLRGTPFLGGPPGSLSPLTPNKSWAQVVASSTPQQIKQQQQQQQNQQSLSASPSNQGELVGDQTKQQQHPSAVKAGVSMPPPPPPPVAVVKPTRSASLRGLSGLGGVSTSSNRDFKSLLLRLKTALDKERDKWRPRSGAGVAASTANESEEVITINGQPTVVSINKTSSSTITGQQRDDCIFWLGWIVRKLRFSEETMALSASLFDAILTSGGSGTSAVAVTPENCRLVALICLLLSAKFSEEDADVPTTKDLLAVSEIGVDGTAAANAAGATPSTGNDAASVEAALRMERVILTALEWDLNRPTPLKFLEILHTLLLCHQPQLLEDVALGLTPTKHLERLTWKMQKIVACHQLAFSFRPAILAVALLSVDLESIGVSDWQVVSATLEKICQIGGSGGNANNAAANGERHKLARCKNLIVRLLAGDRKAISGSAVAQVKTVWTTAVTGSVAGEVVGANGRGGRAVSGGGGAVVRKAVPATESWSETPEKKRTMTKLKRKHVPSESGGMIDVSAAAAMVAASDANASSTSTTSSSTGSSSSKTTLKRVFNIAESPTCKSEARSEEEAAANRGGIAAADRFSALQGLCNYIY